MPAIDASGLIPESQSSELITVAASTSAALTLGRRVPMPAGVTKLPVLSALPVASFIGVGGRKPFTGLTFDNETLTAEEVAATVAIPQAYLDDSAVALWDAVRPELGGAIARAVDGAVFWGTGAPASFPTGGILTGLTPVAGSDVVDTVNLAMGEVESSGVAVTAHAADLSDKQALRGVRDTNGALLLGSQQVSGSSIDALYGYPIKWLPFFHNAAGTVDFVTGAWNLLVVGVRQDIRYELDSSGVIADEAGAVVISAFQDDMVLMRVYMRLGIAVAKPLAPNGQPVKPFAVAKLGATPES